MQTLKKTIPTLFVLLLLPSLALAHSAGHIGGFMAGLKHPVLGMDHLLAMVCVGILSAQMGGKAIWTVPATFVVVMLIGGVAGMNGFYYPVEVGIAVSVLALGLAIAASIKMPVLMAMVFVGFFALFHGLAHGLEMPYLSKPITYALGFVSSTALIHIAGVGIGLIAEKLPSGHQLLRFAGAFIGGIGFTLAYQLRHVIGF
jgi:urease accessory protein